jgi:hypothetical protein
MFTQLLWVEFTTAGNYPSPLTWCTTFPEEKTIDFSTLRTNTKQCEIKNLCIGEILSDKTFMMKAIDVEPAFYQYAFGSAAEPRVFWSEHELRSQGVRKGSLLRAPNNLFFWTKEST